jgi:hypothetical protein
MIHTSSTVSSASAAPHASSLLRSMLEKAPNLDKLWQTTALQGLQLTLSHHG